MASRMQVKLRRLGAALGLQRDWYLVVMGAALGAITAFAAIGFSELLHLAGKGATELLNVWPLWTLPLLPMTGALLTGLLVHFYAREARGHGVPEVMDAIYRRGSRIRRRVAIVKALTSVLTIGSGGSAGTEGPIVQIGAAIGSGSSQLLRVSREHAGTLLGCGAAAGIASVFNAPIAGVFFVLEILLRDFSVRTFIPIVIASVFSTAVTQSVLGQNDAIFEIAAVDYVFSLVELPGYLVLGLLCGLAAALFTKLLYRSEDLAEKIPIHPILKPVIGAALLGALGVVYVANVELPGAEATLPPFFGNGYPTILALIDPEAFQTASEGVTQILHPTIGFAILLFTCKLLATCLTLGSGGSGGVFAPSLFLGASVGAMFGMTLQSIGLLPAEASPAAYALVGMAALVAGTTHAPLTAILIVFEITRDVYVLLPIMLAAVIATLLAQVVMRDSIYTLKLRRRGVLIGAATDLTLLRRISARDVPIVPHVAVTPHDPISRLLELNRTYQVVDFVVVDDNGEYLGMVTGQDLRTALIEREAMPLLLVEDLLRTDLPTIDPDETLDVVLNKFSRFDLSSLALTRDGKVQGLLTRSRLMQRYQKALAEA